LFISGRELSCSETSIFQSYPYIYRDITVSDIDALVGRTVKHVVGLTFQGFTSILVAFLAEMEVDSSDVGAVGVALCRTGSLYNPCAMKKHILSISYDESLLVTRQMILETAGFDVSSALGFAEALELCRKDPNFDLVLMGHSIPRKDKSALIAALRPACKAPVLSVRRHGDPPLPEANCSVDSFDGPQVLLDAVHSALGSNGPLSE
jgi:CheY-like chemotaxis protein